MLLISRSAAKLQAVKSELVSEHKEAMVETLEVDFSALSADRRAAVEKAVGGKDVGVLVNNVGISYAFAQWFDELTDAEVQSLISLNVESTTWMTRAVLPGMLQRQRGVVVNMSSAAARSPLPLLAQYSAAKGYIENLTRSLAAEYATKGVAFQCQSPLWVATAMTFPGSKVPIDERATLLTPTATTFARASVARIGNGVMVSPYWTRRLLLGGPTLAARLADDPPGAKAPQAGALSPEEQAEDGGEKNKVGRESCSLGPASASLRV